MISQIERYLKDISTQYDCTEKFPSILISLTEAVNNAIIHGNNSDENKTVHIKVKHINKGLLFVVKDEGTGFDRSTICDPTKSGNIERVGGRGVFIMDKLCDKLTYVNNGSTVKMYFKLS